MFGSLPGYIFLENILKRSESSQVSGGRPATKKGVLKRVSLLRGKRNFTMRPRRMLLPCGTGSD